MWFARIRSTKLQIKNHDRKYNKYLSSCSVARFQINTRFRIAGVWKTGGIDYALRYGEYHEQELLGGFYDRSGGGGIDGFMSVAEILSDKDGSEQDTYELLRERLGYGDQIDKPSWAQAFVESAVEKFRELQAEL